ncbi:MAG: hypothetical protein HOP11_01515 [Saprospiraceae bacterium]|nr:hypothetical protein [Saprospiraceae bacterium]
MTTSILIAIVQMSCNKNECEEQLNNNCFCTADYNPVCGCNNITYSNSCQAECREIKEYTKGICK